MGGASFIGCTIMLPEIIGFIHEELKKMRIVAGTYRSRVIQSVPGDSTRPTQAKIKEAIFSRIGPYFDGGDMLDLFAGSGNMGFEALSRGITSVTFCDCNYKAVQTIKTNAATLKASAQCHIFKMDYEQLLQRLIKEKRTFDLIYLDPPYRKQRIHEILTLIDCNGLLKESGNVVCESLKEDSFSESYGSLYQVKSVDYGITKITYYKR